MTRTAGSLAAGAVALFFTAFLAAPAAAELTGEAVANLTGGATTNPLLAPDGSPAIGTDAFTTVRAGIRAHETGPRVVQLFSYTYAGTFFVNHTEADGQIHDLLWTLTATPTARTDLRAQLGATYGYLNSINPLAATANLQNIGGAGFPTIPEGPVRYVGANANLNGFYRPDGLTTWSELTGVTTFVPVEGDAGQSVVVLQNGHYERLWGRNALTLDALGSYFNASSFTYANGAGRLPGTETFQLQGLVGWRHEFTPTTFVGAGGGALLVDARLVNQLTVEPLAFATAHYQTEAAMAELIITQSSQLNVYLGQPLLIDAAIARMVLPLDRLQRFRAVGLGTVQREWTFGPPLNAALDLVAADVGMTFQPLRYPFFASIDYALQQQIGHTVGTTIYPSLHRQIVMLTLTATWGTDAAVR